MIVKKSCYRVKKVTFERITTEYYTVPKTDYLEQLLSKYKESNSICYSLNERQLLLYIVNKAIENNGDLYSGELCFELKQNIKLKKTRLIKSHFNSISNEYQKYGIKISQRQYFHRLVLGFLVANISEVSTKA